MKLRINEKFVIILFTFFSILGYTVNVNFSYVSLVTIICFILFSSYKKTVYLIFLLIPNIRIFDNTGFINYVNLIIYLIGFIYLLNSFKLEKTDLIFLTIFILFEVAHIGLYIGKTSFNDEIIAIITFFWNLLICLILLRNRKEISLEKINNHLIIGLFISILVKTLTYGTDFINYFLSTNDRFSAFSGDPNYFSMYLLLAITYILFYVKKCYRNYMIFIMLALTGIFTSSKMFVLIFIFLCIIFVFYNIKYKKFLLYSIPLVFLVGCIIVYLFGDIINPLIDKVFLRFFSNESQVFNISKMTTGRSDLFVFYIKQLFSNISLLFLGNGMRYNYLFNQLVAHNTYLDILLSWGIAVSITFIFYIFKIIKGQVQKFKIYSTIQCVIFLIIIFSLSSFTADMFFYLLFLVVLPIMEERDGKNISVNVDI
jgi:hypothetical protein